MGMSVTIIKKEKGNKRRKRRNKEKIKEKLKKKFKKKLTKKLKGMGKIGKNGINE